MKNQEENIELQKKVYGGSFVRGITFLTARPRSFVVFCRFFDLLGFYEEEEIFLWKIVGDLGPSCPPPPPSPPPPLSKGLLLAIINYTISSGHV